MVRITHQHDFWSLDYALRYIKENRDVSSVGTDAKNQFVLKTDRP